VLLRSGVHVDRAVPALVRAVERAMEHDLAEGDGSLDHDLDYDLGCDLQEVAASLAHAGADARQAVPVLVRAYEGGDLALRRAVLRALVSIGGTAAATAVDRWRHDFAVDPPDVPDVFRIGQQAALRAASDLLTEAPAAHTARALLAMAAESFVAAGVLDAYVGRLYAADSPGVTKVIGRARSGGDRLVEATAAAALQRLGLEAAPVEAPLATQPVSPWTEALKQAAQQVRTG